MTKHHVIADAEPQTPKGSATQLPYDSSNGDLPREDHSGVPNRYEELLANLARADQELEAGGSGGRSLQLEAASAIVFDLLYSLDFRNGGELVPRLAALYGYFANELLAVGRTRDRAQLARLRDMIATLRHSWHGTPTEPAAVS